MRTIIGLLFLGIIFSTVAAAWGVNTPVSTDGAVATDVATERDTYVVWATGNNVYLGKESQNWQPILIYSGTTVVSSPVVKVVRGRVLVAWNENGIVYRWDGQVTQIATGAYGRVSLATNGDIAWSDGADVYLNNTKLYRGSEIDIATEGNDTYLVWHYAGQILAAVNGNIQLLGEGYSPKIAVERGKAVVVFAAGAGIYSIEYNGTWDTKTLIGTGSQPAVAFQSGRPYYAWNSAGIVVNGTRVSDNLGQPVSYPRIAVGKSVYTVWIDGRGSNVYLAQLKK